MHAGVKEKHHDGAFVLGDQLVFRGVDLLRAVKSDATLVEKKRVRVDKNLPKLSRWGDRGFVEGLLRSHPSRASFRVGDYLRSAADSYSVGGMASATGCTEYSVGAHQLETAIARPS